MDHLRLARPDAELGVWQAGHVPRPPEEPGRTPTRQLVAGATATALAAWIAWALLWNGYLGKWWVWPLFALVPDTWVGTWGFVVATWVYYAAAFGILVGFFANLGSWPELVKRAVATARRARAVRQVTMPSQRSAPPPESDPAAWPALRAAGETATADRLTAELGAGQLGDVDYGRISHAWRCARTPDQRAEIVADVQRRGGGAVPHSSGARDLPSRAARHDVILGQVRIGTATNEERNPYLYRGVGVALAPSTLTTGALVVGPSAAETDRIVRPIIESACMRALTGQSAAVVVTARGDQAAPGVWFDGIRRPADGAALPLYGDADPADPAAADDAANTAAEALVGDMEMLPGGDSRTSATALAQLLGPYRAAYGRWPEIRELRDLVTGGPPITQLRTDLEAKAALSDLAELGAFERQMGNAAVGALGERAALLARPAWAALVTAAPAVPAPLDRPVRTRIDLPARAAHVDVGGILTRLVFTACADVIEDRGHAVLLVLDDATGAVTAQSVRALRRLRAARAGVVLTLRALTDVAGPLRAPTVGAVGCRAVCAGVTPQDGVHFAEAWGEEWTESRTVTDRQLTPDEPMGKIIHGVRRLVTGRHVTAQSVSVRRERRERWPATDLSSELPAGHAVVSLTDASGTRTSPLLVHLGT